MAAFVLPPFIRKDIEKWCGSNGKPPKPVQLGVSLGGAAAATGVALLIGIAAGALGAYLAGSASNKGAASASATKSGR